MSWKLGMKVAVALIPDAQQRVLITQRPFHVSHGGLWEFPGGKLEQNESPAEALVREIKEEVGLEVLEFECVQEITHHYPNFSVNLFVFYITQYTGIPKCLVGQLGMKWVSKKELKYEDFPAGNHSIFDLIDSRITSSFAMPSCAL
jgi:8-oxo-dGTP diphosphatase